MPNKNVIKIGVIRWTVLIFQRVTTVTRKTIKYGSKFFKIVQNCRNISIEDLYCKPFEKFALQNSHFFPSGIKLTVSEKMSS
jgi:hypothetical protein